MIVFRLEKGEELTHKELDDNFRFKHKWTSGTTFELEEVVLYNFSFWECITKHNSTTVFDSSKWEKISGNVSGGDDTNTNINFFWSDVVEQSNTISVENDLGVRLWEIGRPVYIFKNNKWIKKTDANYPTNYFDLDGPSNVIKYTNSSHPSMNSVKDALDLLLYTPLQISLSGGSVNEIGSVIQTINLSWGITGGSIILSQEIKLNGTVLFTPTIGTTTKTLTNQNINSNKTYSISVSDDMSVKTANTTFSFYPKLYSGKSIVPTNYTSNFILSLSTHTLKSSKSTTFTATPLNNEYIWFCVPTIFGTPKFFVGGFEGGFQPITTIQHTNLSGYTQNYEIWRSDYPNLGNTTVVVQ